jgi:hypothetical protein
VLDATEFRAKKMKYPYKKLVVPAEIEKLGNGKLKPAMLAPVKCGGKMYTPVAAKFNELYDAAFSSRSQTPQRRRLPFFRSATRFVQATLPSC